jgi:hypothetical protein
MLIFLTILVLWQTVYSVSFAFSLFKSKNKTGGGFILSLLLLILASFVVFLYKNNF